MTTNDSSDYTFSVSLIMQVKRQSFANGIPIREPFAVPFRLPVEMSCIVTVRVLDDGSEQAAYQFTVLKDTN